MSSRHPPRIGLIGEFGMGNFGNDGSLQAMLLAIRARRPDAELLCICKDPAEIERRFAIPSVPLDAPAPRQGAPQWLNRALFGMPARLQNLAHTLQHVRGLDALIVPGAGVLDDFGQTPGGLPYDLWRWCHAARLGGAKVAFVSVGAGPIHNPLSRLLMRNAAACAHYRSYRDEASKAFMAGIGLRRPGDAVYPDLAFALPAPPPPERIAEAPATVAVGVMKYFGWRAGAQRETGSYGRYLDRMLDYVAWLLEGGHRVIVVVGDEIDRETAEELSARLRARVPLQAASSLLVDDSVDLHGVMRGLALADIVVATRFHNLVCALRVGKPAISLGYAVKNRELLKAFELGEFCQAIEDFDLALLKTQTERLLAQRRLKASAIERKLAEVRAALERQQDLLDRSIIAP